MLATCQTCSRHTRQRHTITLWYSARASPGTLPRTQQTPQRPLGNTSPSSASSVTYFHDASLGHPFSDSIRPCPLTTTGQKLPHGHPTKNYQHLHIQLRSSSNHLLYSLAIKKSIKLFKLRNITELHPDVSHNIL